MSLILKINDVDKSSLVLWKSLKWNQNLTSQVDSMTFKIQKFGSRTYAPAILDEVTLDVGGAKVFGGNIVAIDEDVVAVDRIIYTIQVKDYQHLIDRRLIIESYTDKPVRNIICDVLNRYVNKGDRVEISTFENTETWQGGTVDTTDYIVGDQARKLTSTNAVLDSMYRDIVVNLEPTGFTPADYIELDVWVDDLTKLTSAVIKLGNAALTSYYYKDVTSQLSTGHNIVRVAKSGFSSTGTPAWASIARVKCEVVSTASNTVNVTFDNWQLVKTTAFTRDNCEGATQVVKYIAFNYEYPSKAIQRMAELFQWEWYVDENKGVNFFAKFDKTATFNLTDTGGNYIYDTLRINNNADQMRNSIYVRGGDYLAPAITENLSHQADGANKIFKLGYKYADYALTQNSVLKPVGVDNLDQYTANNGSNQLTYGGTALKIGDVAANTRQAEQIIVTKAGRRSAVKLRLRKVGAPADNLQIQVFTDSGSNTPSATNKSTVTSIAAASLTTSIVEYTVTLTEAATGDLFFAVDDRYHVVLNRSGANDAANYYEVDCVAAGNYIGVSNTYNASWALNGSNFYFQELIDYDVLYSFNEKILKFSTAPAAIDTITWAAAPYLPIIIKYRDITSVNSYDEYEYKVIDKSIKTKDGAKQRALQEILGWAQAVSEASFKTYVDGLRVGQTINIQSTIRDLDYDLIINQITAKARTGDALEYSVSLVSTKTMGLIYWFQEQINKDNQEIVIDENEQSDKIEYLSTEFSFSTEYDHTIYTGKVWSNDALTTPNALQFDGGAADIWI